MSVTLPSFSPEPYDKFYLNTVTDQLTPDHKGYHLLDLSGMWVSKYALVIKKNESAWVHRMCALFANGAYMQCHRWYGVAKSVSQHSESVNPYFSMPHLSEVGPLLQHA